MPEFTHADALSSSIGIDIEGPGPVQTVLIVRTRLRLFPAAQEYDEARVSGLVQAATAFKTQHNIGKVRLVSEG